MTETSSVRSSAPAQQAWATGLLRRGGVLVALILLVAISTALSDRFLTVPNLLNVLRQVSIVGILAVGMTFVILTKGIDLSIGSILGVAVVLFAGLLETQSMAVAIPLGIAAATVLGLVNGVGVAFAGIPPFIMTWECCPSPGPGLSLYRRHAIPIIIEAVYDLGNGYLLGVPNPTWIWSPSFCRWVICPHTLRRSVYAIGSNEDAARLSGVRCGAIWCVYVISGFVAGIAGLVFASQLSVGTPIAGQGYELDAIAAVVVGGTSLFGGRGRSAER
jgi:ribose/xylose/arabinose/galactoside ABC-type transport system permease subunit